MNLLDPQDISYQKQKAAAGYYYQGQAMDKIWVLYAAVEDGARVVAFRSKAKADEAAAMIKEFSGVDCNILEVKVSQ